MDRCAKKRRIRAEQNQKRLERERMADRKKRKITQRKSREMRIYIFFNRHLVWFISAANIFYIALLFFVSNMSLQSEISVNACTVAVGIILFVSFAAALCSPACAIANFRKNRPEGDGRKIYILMSILFHMCLIFAALYALIIAWDKDAFVYTYSGGALPDHWFFRSVDLLYHSIATFTTLGYGDFVPVSWVARLAVSVEALMFNVVISFVLVNYFVNKRNRE